MKPSEMSTPALIEVAAKALRTSDGDLAAELDIRSARLGELEYQATPGRNDLAGQTPAQLMAIVNAPSPQEPA